MAQHHSHFWTSDAQTDEHCRDCGCMWDSAEAAIKCGHKACVNCGEPCDAGMQLCACCLRYDSVVAEYGELALAYPEAGSSVSHGTMRNEDLLCAFADELSTILDLRPAAMSGHPALVAEARSIMAQYEADLDAVDGCYFGAHEGDGSDYGYWSADNG